MARIPLPEFRSFAVRLWAITVAVACMPAISWAQNDGEPARPVAHSRNSPTVNQAVESLTQPLRRSLVMVESQLGARSLGTVVARGLVVVKSSELSESFQCRAGGKLIRATLIARDPAIDLALLEVDSDLLLPILIGEKQESLQTLPKVGRFVVSVGQSGAEAQGKLGVVSTNTALSVKQPPIDERVKFGVETSDTVVTRELLKAFQNENLQSVSGLEVESVLPRSLGETCGLLVGDVIIGINDLTISSSSQLRQWAGELKPQQRVSLRVWRAGSLQTFAAVADRIASQLPLDRWGGGPFSGRRFEFGTVICHDTPISLEDVGGPLLNLQGEVIGINIARSTRVASLALPIKKVKQFVETRRPDAQWRTSSNFELRQKP